MALLPGGGYAEEVVVDRGSVMRIPKAMTWNEAGAIPETFLTAFLNVFELARAKAGETLLVHGGGSGIGTFAIQLAAARGARVFTTARALKHPILLDLGAEVAIDYTTDDFAKAVHTATGGRGVDVILDIMGASYLERNVASLATGGRLVVIGLQGGLKGELNLGLMLGKRASIIATTLRSRPDAEKAAIIADVREHVWPLIESGLVRPIVHSRVSIEDAAAAHRTVEANEHTGKVLLVTA